MSSINVQTCKCTNPRLGVNIDHVATIRQARQTLYPQPVKAALAAIRGGADQITIHLREDRRHIQDDDLSLIKREIGNVPLNLEMAAVREIVEIACCIRPATCTLVPERRKELTTEGGLDVATNKRVLAGIVDRLKQAGIVVSMFIDPETKQIAASEEIGANAVEFHTGAYCDAVGDVEAERELKRLSDAVRFTSRKPLKLCAGHGLNYENTARVVEALPEIVEYNIGHAIVARAVFVGMEEAVREMKQILGTRDRGPGTRNT